MTDLEPMTALGATTARVENFGALTLRENDGLALASLTVRKGGARPGPMGLTLPDAGGWAEAGGWAAFWTGPDQWMFEASDRASDDVAAELRAVCAGCSITEQTDGFVCFEVTSADGPAPISRMLEKLVNVDLAEFGAGRATRTAFDHMAIFVIRRRENHLAIIGMRSAAESLWHAIKTAAARM